MINLKKKKSSTKVLIVAAGLGSRLKSHTKNIPKCLLDIGGKTLLEHQLSTYRNLGLNDISIIRGHMKDKIDYSNLKYFDNDDYKNNNILNSIFCAEKIINDNIIIAYSDILFESNIVSTLLYSKKDISIVVDIDWQKKYIDRKDHPITEAESVIYNSNNEVVKIGKIATNNKFQGEFIGMMKLSKKGAKIFKKNYFRAKKIYWNKPFHRSKSFQLAYLTDMLQELVDINVKVNCVAIKRGWKEIDTEEDYKKILKEFKK